jgi:hypothetical protein
MIVVARAATFIQDPEPVTVRSGETTLDPVVAANTTTPDRAASMPASVRDALTRGDRYTYSARHERALSQMAEA